MKFLQRQIMIDLRKGILLEGGNNLMEWGTPLRLLAKRLKAEKDNKGDRVIYFWGNQKILNGLELQLQSFYWKPSSLLTIERFSSIEFWAIGDASAEENFEIISKHLISQFGDPSEKNEKDVPEKHWTWEIERVTMRLAFFEQHAYKTHFEIKSI